MQPQQKRIKSVAPIVKANAQTIRNAAKELAAGNLVSFPTETVYGLGADAGNDRAVANIFTAKKRPDFNPLIIHVKTAENAFALGKSNATAQRLANHFWPGGLSLVVRRLKDAPVSPLATAGLQTIALRVPAHPVAQSLLQSWGGAIAAPSANPSGCLSPTCAEHVADAMGDANIACILDGGPADLGLESTVVGCLEDGDAILLRPGSISRDDIEEILDTPLREVTKKIADDDDMTKGSPGRLARHYAPKAPLRLHARDVRPGEFLLAFGKDTPPGPRYCLNLSSHGCLREAAANLFSYLARLDMEARRVGGDVVIAVMPIPERGLGLAINDRLRRGATREKEGSVL